MRAFTFAAIALMAAVSAAVPANAALKPGAKAQDFTTRGAMAGSVFKVHLKAALKKGPVVLYFFPAAFTPGCSAEARAFAQSIDDFHKAGATVIGMSADTVDKLVDFSKKDCAGQFAVASAGPTIIKAYDVALPIKNAQGEAKLITNRTSYVIASDGSIFYVHSDLNAADHVKNTLDAVRRLHASHS